MGMLLLMTEEQIPKAGKSVGHSSCRYLPQPKGNFSVEQLWIHPKVATAVGISVEEAWETSPTSMCSSESRTHLLQGHILHRSGLTDPILSYSAIPSSGHSPSRIWITSTPGCPTNHGRWFVGLSSTASLGPLIRFKGWLCGMSQPSTVWSCWQHPTGPGGVDI